MPHKKAKLSAREEAKRLQGSDLVPKSHSSVETEPIPKSMARVLGATAVREAFKKRKREAQEDGTPNGSGQRKKRKVAIQEEPLHILPGESLTSFNRRVEDTMRPQIREAVQTGLANNRKQAAEEKAEKEKRKDLEKEQSAAKKDGGSKKDSSTVVQEKKKTNDKPSDALFNPRQPTGKTEFETLTSQKPKRLNDIVEAPPDLSALRKKNKALQSGKADMFGKGDVISPEQKRMMEIEREKAIRRYRELKEKREVDKARTGLTVGTRVE